MNLMTPSPNSRLKGEEPLHYRAPGEDGHQLRKCKKGVLLNETSLLLMNMTSLLPSELVRISIERLTGNEKKGECGLQ
jgi:hypothetical protein